MLTLAAVVLTGAAGPLAALPLTLLLVAAGLHRHVPPLVFVLVALVVVTPVAWASFVVVEAPAMRLARRGPVGRTAAAQPLVVDLREPALPVAVRTPQRER